MTNSAPPTEAEEQAKKARYEISRVPFSCLKNARGRAARLSAQREPRPGFAHA